MLSIGIDFGTSNSSVAVYDGRAVRVLALDPHARDPRVLRSLLYITREGEEVAGQRALDLYSEQNTGREVKLERVLVGEIDMTFAEIGTLHRHVFALVDTNAPGRLFQSLKRFLPETSFGATDVFGKGYRLEDLVGLLARKMIEAAEEDLGEKIDRLVVGRPVHFSEEPEKDVAARERLATAWRIAGVREVEFLEEPVAAVHHFASESGIAPDAAVLIFDFGGGTLDITVARQTRDGVRVLATGGAPLGGDRIDSRIMESSLAQSFGEGARYRHNGLPVPSHLFSRLRTWQTILELNQPGLLSLIRRARAASDRPRELAALEMLVTRNYGFELFRSIEAAKITLSEDESALVELDLDDVDIRRELSRGDFEAAIGAYVSEARRCVLATVAGAGCAPKDIAVVVTTGGSSLIPAFRRMLREALPRADLRASATFTSVAAGLAIWGWNRR